MCSAIGVLYMYVLYFFDGIRASRLPDLAPWNKHLGCHGSCSNVHFRLKHFDPSTSQIYTRCSFLQTNEYICKFFQNQIFFIPCNRTSFERCLKAFSRTSRT
ncbi:uncharacterized protein C8R40DRAFT_1120700 [Lentinula edodes]|uniref:uncharacterized protein n=1 Tax=Lentinula edodes TaxID=5353 RepID=UPI001E8E4B7B|nr:uncharacterized protein C8R40DRAFT_1120700 [Lentinula edodes]KAH7871882.1 hypothetical protein C8R40DRAFT_1120700 [Lentinula edodes]